MHENYSKSCLEIQLDDRENFLITTDLEKGDRMTRSATDKLKHYTKVLCRKSVRLRLRKTTEVSLLTRVRNAVALNFGAVL